MKKLQKMAIIILILSSIYMLICNPYVYAQGFVEVWNTGIGFLDTGSSSIDGIDGEGLKAELTMLVDFLWGIGLMFILISTVILGIKYMLVNPNEKSRIKQATTPYIIAVVVIFGAVTIWKLVINILDGSLMGR